METLSRLWMEGKTARQIADLIGNGVTRNAVIGKVHRLGLCSGENVGARTAMMSSGASVSGDGNESAPESLPEKALVDLSGAKASDRTIAETRKSTPPRPDSVTIADLTDDTCRWPVDDPNSTGFRYCGSPVVGAAPYCARHSKLAYQPTKPVRRPQDRNALFPGLVAIAPKQ